MKAEQEEIISKIVEFLDKFPNVRFTQALYIMNILSKDRDSFYNTDKETLENIRKYEEREI